ncbi:type IV secretion system protein [Moraxella osloensis]|nr:type IV secretion system protein [Moraxella osloensis]MBW4016815.1 type IV secretion system protein [Moraxella osloensis]MBW4019211.1 type IV secretion system protein [Moraxella osloensis]
MAAAQFFTDLFTSITTMTDGIGNGMANLVNVIMPLGLACFTCYLLYIALSYLEGVDLGMMMIDWIKRIFALSVIIGLGLNISTYTNIVFPFVTHLGDDLAQAWTGNSSANLGTMLDGIVNQVSQITDTNMELAAKASDTLPPDPNATAGTIPSTGTTDPNTETGIVDSVIGVVNNATDAVFGAVIGSLKNEVIAFMKNMIIWIAAWAFLIIAAAFLLIATVLLVILAALGPVFFMFAIFPATRQYFNNWVGQVLSNSFLFLLTSVTATIFINYINQQLAAITGGDWIETGLLATENISMIFCMFFIFGVILLQLPNLASSLFGGLAANGVGTMINSIKNATSIGRGGKKGKDSKGAGDSGGAVTPEGKGRS